MGKGERHRTRGLKRQQWLLEKSLGNRRGKLNMRRMHEARMSKALKVKVRYVTVIFEVLYFTPI